MLARGAACVVLLHLTCSGISRTARHAGEEFSPPCEQEGPRRTRVCAAANVCNGFLHRYESGNHCKAPSSHCAQQETRRQDAQADVHVHGRARGPADHGQDSHPADERGARASCNYVATWQLYARAGPVLREKHPALKGPQKIKVMGFVWSKMQPEYQAAWARA